MLEKRSSFKTHRTRCVVVGYADCVEDKVKFTLESNEFLLYTALTLPDFISVRPRPVKLGTLLSLRHLIWSGPMHLLLKWI